LASFKVKGTTTTSKDLTLDRLLFLFIFKQQTQKAIFFPSSPMLLPFNRQKEEQAKKNQAGRFPFFETERKKCTSFKSVKAYQELGDAREHCSQTKDEISPEEKLR